MHVHVHIYITAISANRSKELEREQGRVCERAWRKEREGRNCEILISKNKMNNLKNTRLSTTTEVNTQWLSTRYRASSSQLNLYTLPKKQSAKFCCPRGQERKLSTGSCKHLHTLSPQLRVKISKLSKGLLLKFYPAPF